jgi:hypothetical protein
LLTEQALQLNHSGGHVAQHGQQTHHNQQRATLQTPKGMAMQNNGWMWIRAMWKVVFVVSLLWAGGARAQWLPAPIPINCNTMYGSGATLFPTRTIPNPVVAGEAYEIELRLGSELIEYYFEIVGAQLRLNARVRQLFLGFERTCYRFIAPPTLNASISTFAEYKFTRLNDTQPFFYSTPNLPGSIPFPVIERSLTVPTSALTTILLLVFAILLLAGKKLRAVVVITVCYLIAPPLWRIHIAS